MTLAALNDDQADTVERIARRLGCWPDDVRVQTAPDLPPMWISVEIGRDKGRPKLIELDPEGHPR